MASNGMRSLCWVLRQTCQPIFDCTQPGLLCRQSLDRLKPVYSSLNMKQAKQGPTRKHRQNWHGTACYVQCAALETPTC
eukprot:6197801-Pleurochrysis_carterae.AAC.4